jgi:hypothetical protein
MEAQFRGLLIKLENFQGQEIRTFLGCCPELMI